eukprot:gene698-biopygen446
MIKPINDHSQEDLQNVYCDTPQKVVEEAPGFFSCATLKVAQVNLITGLMYGYMIGYVGVYSTMYDFSTRCSDYKSRGSCTSLQNANCDWVTEGTGAPYCGWVDQPACKQLYFDEHSCEQVHRCTWDYGDKKCGNARLHGGTEGRLRRRDDGGRHRGQHHRRAGNGSPGPEADVPSRRRVFLLGGVLYHVSIAVDSFWCLCVSRLVVGVACGVHRCPHVRCAERCAAVPGQHRVHVPAVAGLRYLSGVFCWPVRGPNDRLRGRGPDRHRPDAHHRRLSVLLCIPVILLGIFLGGKSATDENGRRWRRRRRSSTRTSTRGAR